MSAETTEVNESPASNHLALGDPVRVNLSVPAMVRKEWKAAALAADQTLTELIIEAMKRQINHMKHK